MPIWAFHGGADEIVPTSAIEGPIDEPEACTDPPPEDVRLTIYPEADHDAWTQTYDLSAGHDIYAWLLGHEKLVTPSSREGELLGHPPGRFCWLPSHGSCRTMAARERGGGPTCIDSRRPPR